MASLSPSISSRSSSSLPSAAVKTLFSVPDIVVIQILQEEFSVKNPTTSQIDLSRKRYSDLITVCRKWRQLLNTPTLSLQFLQQGGRITQSQLASITTTAKSRPLLAQAWSALFEAHYTTSTFVPPSASLVESIGRLVDSHVNIRLNHFLKWLPSLTREQRSFISRIHLEASTAHAIQCIILNYLPRLQEVTLQMHERRQVVPLPPHLTSLTLINKRQLSYNNEAYLEALTPLASQLQSLCLEGHPHLLDTATVNTPFVQQCRALRTLIIRKEEGCPTVCHIPPAMLDTLLVFNPNLKVLGLSTILTVERCTLLSRYCPQLTHVSGIMDYSSHTTALRKLLTGCKHLTYLEVVLPHWSAEFRSTLMLQGLSLTRCDLHYTTNTESTTPWEEVRRYNSLRPDCIIGRCPHYVVPSARS